jgi:hypothetical protein
MLAWASPIATVPALAAPAFAPTVNRTVALPVPDAGVAPLIQSTVLRADH